MRYIMNVYHYSYCLNNPLKFRDPTGWIWETVADSEKANQLIAQAMVQMNLKQASLNDLMNVAKPNKLQQSAIFNLNAEIAYLNAGIANLTEMGKTEDATYHFKLLSKGEGGVKLRSDGVLDIEHTNDAMAWHESVHIGDSREKPSLWNFTKEGYLGTIDANGKSPEYKAYRSQYSFDNKSLIYSNGAVVQRLSDVIEWVKFHGFDKK